MKMSEDAARPNPGNVLNRPRNEIPEYGRDANGLNPDVLVRRTTAVTKHAMNLITRLTAVTVKTTEGHI